MKKLTVGYIKEQFEKEEYQLLTSTYINAHRTLLDYVCPKGHKHSVSWFNWRQGHKCPFCYGNAKLTIEFIRSEFEKAGYELLTTEYKNNLQKLDYICSKGHRHNISWNGWHRGQRCPYCDGQGKPTIEFIRSEFIKEDYILLTEKYINAHQKLNYICKNWHKHSITWGDWQQGSRCPYCANVGKPTIEFIGSEFEKAGYQLLTKEYVNSYQKLEYICDKGHKHSICWNHWRKGSRCPYCVNSISNEEVEVRDFVESLGIKVSANDRNQIVNPETGYGLELDIFLPTLNKAIEYNGEYWHQDKVRDLLKQQLCKDKKIDLLTIWDKEWKINNKECRNRMMRFLSVSSNF